MEETSQLEICYNVLADVNKILVDYCTELPKEKADVLIELSDRIYKHFYGDVE